MKVNFSTIPDNEGGYTPVPEGKYLVEVDSVDEKSTRAGEPMWQLNLRVVEGPHKGKTIRDNITFGHKEKAMQRVKLVCSRLGIDVSRPEEIDLSPADLKGRRAIVEATVEEYDQVVLDKETKQPVTDPVTGQTKTRRAQRNAVPFAGYEPYGATAGGGSRGPVGAASGGESGLSEERLPF